MKNQSTIHDSNPDLDSLAREYGGQLRDASHRLGLRKSHQISPFSNNTNEYGLSVIQTDRHGNVTYDAELMHGTLEDTRHAIHLLLRLTQTVDELHGAKEANNAR
ncbi:MAG: hypothetical protein LKF49_06280 [Bifidobacterium tibiigranuli]|jgi:hypothetical protein|uniref:hypothetical protein n=1 Tax=Bifidobacterium tibiigranuli TaxID=2172043 RepID=UPI0023564B8E|nr:hypothetical protein [Bifidobacterium tibiigranuli]MCH3973805.1 hypothetical protein [Bifidobacterium tibiigranuli]MCH4189415.1 hypothetical protein [Bifidobacterium tibiigranuli]MCH4203800.1 hypothetical protein [Bifidobacterium tibiigranuli]MCH4274358.1 hypothetical protein [Bifidobacterium tibiigranuli]MCI1791419.1 hypothetical protein [Bifidobacterium tibiigranuli]